MVAVGAVVITYFEVVVGSSLTVQAALVLCGLFICDFAYMQMKNWLFFWNLSSNLWL